MGLFTSCLLGTLRFNAGFDSYLSFAKRDRDWKIGLV